MVPVTMLGLPNRSKYCEEKDRGEVLARSVSPDTSKLSVLSQREGKIGDPQDKSITPDTFFQCIAVV